MSDKDIGVLQVVRQVFLGGGIFGLCKGGQSEPVLGKSFLDPAVAGKLLSRVSERQTQPATLITDKLTGREVDVLRLLARGLNNAEIAERLFLSEGTVRNYVSAIFAKLEVSDRTQAAVIAIQHGLGKV
jgi:DNA-binding NarL/FixJ family response regulator